MAMKDRRDKKEKSLEKMTVKELREIGLGLSELIGVHGMNKAELVAAIKKSRGIVDDIVKSSVDIRAVKIRIKEFKAEKVEILQSGGDKKKIDQLRKKISRLKKKTRRAA